MVDSTFETRGCRRRRHEGDNYRWKDSQLMKKSELETTRSFVTMPGPSIQSLHQHRGQHQKFLQPQHRTMMARSSVYDDSEDPSLDPEAKAMTFLVGTLGHDKDVAKGVLDALKQSGVSGGPALLAMVRSLAGRWEVDEDAGLEALVESVTVELARSKGKKTVNVWVLPPNAWASKEGDDETVINDDFKRAFKVEGFEGMTLTDVAKFGDGEGANVLGEMIECSCSGIMACSTCHVVVHSDWFEKVGHPEEAEMDMIDLAYNAQETSRLGCQLVLTPELENAIFKIPRGANNMMDFIPFEDE